MVNFIASVVLLLIALFIVTLFPGGRDFIGDIKSDITEKTNNVVEEYERVKTGVGEVTDKVNEATTQVGNAIDTVNDAVDSAAGAINSVNSLINGDENEEVTEENTEEPAEEEPTSGSAS